MNEQLIKLGLTDAFNSKADFSKMKDDNIFISKAIHKAVVKVDEKGTVGVAATAIMTNSLSIQPPPRKIIIDKPFYFVMVEDNNNLPLFYGKITNPKF